MSILTPVELLAPTGPLAGRLDGYESRPQQLEMTRLVADTLEAGEHLIVEAPTGVGKSLAYLIPCAAHALATGDKVVVSTATIALQEQLVDKDLPLVEQLMPELKPVLVKGRQNYLCRRRLDFAHSGQQALFESREEIQDFEEIRTWAAETTTGDRADMPHEPPIAIWRKVQSDKHSCRGRRCERHQECFFRRARRRIEDAHLLVVNHHLYFSDLALRDEHASILPGHPVVVFDEAHALEDIATDHLGVSIAEAQVRYFCESLWNERSAKGLLADPEFAPAREVVAAVQAANQDFWREVAVYAHRHGESLVRVTAEVTFPPELAAALTRLMRTLTDYRARASDEDASQELRAQADRAAEMAGALVHLANRDLDDHVFYAQVPIGRGSCSLSAHPLSVAEPLRELLFEPTRTVVLTSATLAADDSDRFLFLRRRLGIDGGTAKRLDSPFDFARQARLLVNTTALDPNGPHYERALAQWLGDFLEDASGGTFILFTSYRQLGAVHDLLRGRLDRANRFVFRQGDRMTRRQMLDMFKRVTDGVLFGTTSFWEGVDVRGDALKNVVICKLPFEMPTHPLVEARMQKIKAAGGNPFMERTVPEAILRLKQGVGRLIRTTRDTGTIVICDHRVLTKRYGRYFIRALPTMPIEQFAL